MTRGRVRQRPRCVEAGLLHGAPGPLVYGAVPVRPADPNWERGRPDRRATTGRNLKRRLEDVRAGLYMQTLLREPGAGVMHSLIYFNFLVLLGVTTVLEINHQLPESAKFLHGDVYQAYAFIGDLAGLLFLVGVVWAIVRRYGPRPFGRTASASSPGPSTR